MKLVFPALKSAEFMQLLKKRGWPGGDKTNKAAGGR